MEARKQRNKERLEKAARGEEAEPLEKEEPDEPVNITLWHLIKFLVILTAIVMGSGFFITGDPFWDYQGKWRRIATYLPVWAISLFWDLLFLPSIGLRNTKPCLPKQVWRNLTARTPQNLYTWPYVFGFLSSIAFIAGSRLSKHRLTASCMMYLPIDAPTDPEALTASCEQSFTVIHSSLINRDFISNTYTLIDCRGSAGQGGMRLGLSVLDASRNIKPMTFAA